jgi:diguanylate cyclase (GGDEF)-like protein
VTEVREAATAIPPEAARERAVSARRTRPTFERLAVVVCGTFALIAFLPFTEVRYRDGLLVTSALLFILVMGWLRLVPAGRFGNSAVLAFGLLLQPIVIVLLTLTGGIESPFLPYFLLPVLMTVYSPRTRHTFVMAFAASVSLLVIAVLDREAEIGVQVAERLSIDLIQLAVFVAFAAGIGRALRDARRALATRAEALAAEREDAVRLANTDTLTGLYNRRYADDLLLRLASEAQRGRPFSVIALDVDGMKQVNDAHGHEAGDRVLIRIAEVLRLQLRGADIAVRVGGDEFVLLLPGTREMQAQAVAERLCRAVADRDWSDLGATISISSGVAEWQTAQRGADVVNAADERLYQAKRSRPRSA